MAAAHTTSIWLLAVVVFALSGCGRSGRGEGGDIQLAQAATAGRAAFARGQVADALLYYERALSRGYAMDDATAVADQAYNVSVCLLRLGDTDRVGPLLDEAARAASRKGLPTADILLLRALAARQQENADDAVSYARRALTQCRRAGDADGVLQAQVLIGSVALEAGDTSMATAMLSAARRQAGRARDAAALGSLAGFEADLAQKVGKLPVAAAKYDEQADLLRRARLYREMVAALRKAGAAHVATGQPAAGADRLVRAARAMAAQGDASGAVNVARDAATAAAVSADDALRKRAAALVTELAASTPPAGRAPQEQLPPNESGADAPRSR